MVKKILTVVGARPQFIKAATVSRALANWSDLTEVMVHTGQHYDHNMSDIFFSELDIREPRYNLKVGEEHHDKMIVVMADRLEGVMIRERPDMVLVYGDTNSTLAGALTASKLKIPIAHVEAGLRSFNPSMPEERNRIQTDHLSSLLFCPTSTAQENLKREGITEGVFHVGDVMFDASQFALIKAQSYSTVTERLGLTKGEYALCTIHRAENTSSKESLQLVLKWIKEKARSIPVVLPLHPRTKLAAKRFGLDFKNIILCDPLGYIDMASLLSGSKEVYTDSGGLQKEAYFHQKPCITLRDETEWTETVAAGWNQLWKSPTQKKRTSIREYGDGNTANFIIKLIHDSLV